MKARSDKRAGAVEWIIAQRAWLADRSGGRCEFEVAVHGIMAGETHHQGARIIERVGDVAWVRCARTYGLVGAHVFRRWKNGMLPTADGYPLMFHPDAVIAGCASCHVLFDSRQAVRIVRAPAEAIDRARRIIEVTLAAHGNPAGVVDLTHV